MTHFPDAPGRDPAVSGGLGRPLLSFAGMLILLNAILMGVTFAFPNLEVPTFVNLMVPMFAGMAGGQSFAKANGRAMTGGERTRFALMGAVILVALSALVLAGMFAWYRVPFSLDTLAVALTGDMSLAADIRPWLLPILGLGVLIAMGMVHLGSGIGIKGILNRQAKDAARRD
jgi:hypothetical protein